MPLALTDAELDEVFHAAEPIDPRYRDSFLKELADTLAQYPVLGVGLVHKIAHEVQNRFYQSDVAVGCPIHNRAGLTKYSRPASRRRTG